MGISEDERRLAFGFLDCALISGTDFGIAGRRSPKHTTYRGWGSDRYTRNSAFLDVPGVKAFRSQRLGSCVGLGPGNAQGDA